MDRMASTAVFEGRLDRQLSAAAREMQVFMAHQRSAGAAHWGPLSGRLCCKSHLQRWTNFLSAADAPGVLGRGGPLRLERIHSAAFPLTLRGHRQPKSAISSLLREFCWRGIIDFFNTIWGIADWI